MAFEIVPAHEVPLADQARLNNEAFAGYVGGWTDLEVAAIARLLSSQGAELYYSRFVRAGGDLVGFGYISRTANILRLAGMGVVPAARGSGAADFLIEHLVAEGQERGDEAMVLELIEQNPRAHVLYRRHQFAEIDRLFGWRRAATAGNTNPMPVTEIPLLDALLMRSAHEYPQLPWQVSRHAWSKAAVAHAFASGSACVMIGDVTAKPVRVLGFLSDAPQMQWEALRAILGTIIAHHPEAEFFAPAIFPSGYGEQIFEQLGFEREPISQFLMRRDLNA